MGWFWSEAFQGRLDEGSRLLGGHLEEGGETNPVFLDIRFIVEKRRRGQFWHHEELPLTLQTNFSLGILDFREEGGIMRKSSLKKKPSSRRGFRANAPGGDSEVVHCSGEGCERQICLTTGNRECSMEADEGESLIAVRTLARTPQVTL